MSNIKLDLANFKHLKSDHNTTTLKHNTLPHTITLHHNVLSKTNQEQLKALSKISQEAATEGQKQESQDQSQYGKVIMKKDGGTVFDPNKAPNPPDPNKAKGVADVFKGDKEPNFVEKGISAVGNAIGLGKAEGGEIEKPKYCEHCGSPRKMYADTPELVSKQDSAPEDSTMVGLKNVGNAIKSGANYVKDAATSQMYGHEAPGDYNSAQDSMTYQPPNENGVPEGLQPNQPETPAQPDAVKEDIKAPTEHATHTPTKAPQQHEQKTQAQLANPNAVELPEPPKSLSQEVKMFDDDIKAGHITPKTYADMFADTGTLGRIGMIFGALTGGIGSGLTHGPNVWMDAMNKEIDRDYEAQKTNQGNRLNYRQLAETHVRNLAESGHLGVQDEQTKRELATQSMWRAALDKEWNKIKKMPDGPQKQNAVTAYGIASQGIDSKLQNADAAIQSRQQLMQGITGGDQNTAGQDPEQALAQKVQRMKMSGMKDMAEDIESHHMPGFQQRTNAAVKDADKDKHEAYQNTLRQLQEAINFKKTHPAASWSIGDRASATTLMKNLGNQIRTAEDMGVFKESEAKLMDAMLGSSPADFFSSARTEPKLKEMQRLKQGEHNTLLSKYGITPTTQPQQAQEKPKTVIQNGHTFHLNPKTGKYE